MHNAALIAFPVPSLSAGLTVCSSFQTPVIQQKERKGVFVGGNEPEMETAEEK